MFPGGQHPCPPGLLLPSCGAEQTPLRSPVDVPHAAPLPAPAPAPAPFLRRALVGAALLVALLLIQQALLGRSPFGEPGDWDDVWIAALHCFLVTYLPAAYLLTLASGRRAEEEVARGGPGGTAEGAGRVPSAVSTLPPFGPPTAAWLASGAGALLLVLLGPWLTEPELARPHHFWLPDRWAPEVWWQRIPSLWFGPWLGWYGLALLQVSRRLSALAARVEAPDLFHPGAFRPFVRQGLSNGLTAAGLATAIGLLGLDQGLTWMLLVFGGISLALVAAALLLPMLGVRRRLGAIRAAELAWCDRELARQRERLREEVGGDTGGRLADLATHRRMVEGAGVWGIDAPALRRAALYVFLPLLSWVAGALVQALVEQALG